MTRQNTMTRQDARDQITAILNMVSEQNALPGTSRSKKVDVLQMIDHFINEKQISWIGTPATQKAMQEHGTRVGIAAPHMLHAIIAFSAAHLDHLHPDPELRVTALHHYGRLVAVYAEDLKRLKTGTVNRLFGTCIMLTMLSYLFVGYDNPTLLCNPEEHQCNWDAFRSLGGVRIMHGVPSYHQELSSGVWVSMLREIQERQETMAKESIVVPSWWSNIMAGICDLCNVSRDLQHGDSLYLEPLRGLNTIVCGSLDDTKVGQMMHYIGNLPVPFSQILEALEPRAMLIILYWHVLLMLIGQWWATHTGIVASRRTIAYLWKVGREELRKLLVFPAAVCGLDLQSLDHLPPTEQADFKEGIARFSRRASIPL
jgi:hypothetical protein